jgi:electron transfer flavoprotein alpha subunit
VGEADAFGKYSAEGFTTVIVGFIKEHGCDAAVFSASSLGKDLAPRVAARLGVGYAADCTGLEVQDGTIVATRPEFAGKLIAQVAPTGTPAVISIRPNVFLPAENAKGGEVQSLDVSVNEADFGAIVREIKASAAAKLDVGEAPIIVSGGRGLGGPENFKLIEDLAEAFGGKTVAPTLYIAVGISGAIQHLAGMRTSRYIVAINKDPEAPIFKVADYGIVGDLHQILPRMTEEVRKMMA